MRQLAFALSIVFMLTGIKCWAEDLTPDNGLSTQAIKIESSGGVFKIQKQPITEKSKQQMTAKKCFFCVFVQINGKVKEDLK